MSGARVYLSTDIEGTAGIVDWTQVLGPGPEFPVAEDPSLWIVLELQAAPAAAAKTRRATGVGKKNV